jgi:hypothetical protein
MRKEDYGVKAKPITVRNPQANAIVDRFTKFLEILSVLLSWKITTWMTMFLGKES